MFVFFYTRGAQMAARGPDQARQGLQSGPRRLFEVQKNMYKEEIKAYVRDILFQNFLRV